MKIAVTPTTTSIVRDVAFDVFVRVSMTMVGAAIDIELEQKVGAAGAMPWTGAVRVVAVADPPGSSNGTASTTFRVSLAGPCSAAHLAVSAHDAVNGWFCNDACTVVVT
jgi:hypothetical protein